MLDRGSTSEMYASSRVNADDRDNFLLFSIHSSYRPKRITNRFIPWECDSIFSTSSMAVRDKEHQRFQKKKKDIYIYYLKILYHESRQRQTTITFITSIFDRSNYPSSTNLIRKRESYRTFFFHVPMKISKPLFTFR